MQTNHTFAVIGAGNIGTSLAQGLAGSSLYRKSEIFLVRRNIDRISHLKGYRITNDSAEAVRNAEIIVISVLPQQIDALLGNIQPVLGPDQLVISVVTGVHTEHIKSLTHPDQAVVRAMPNTAIAIGQSMTCLSGSAEYLPVAKEVFDTVGHCIVIDEEHMRSATALCGCGMAFFLRAIRAASQGGIQIGFHADEALRMASQTAKGAASLLLEYDRHPEREIDKVTSPEGCTIAGLNEMEHHGFSSAMIRGIVGAADKAASLHDHQRKAAPNSE